MSIFDRIRDTAEDVADTAGDAIDSVTGDNNGDSDSGSGSTSNEPEPSGGFSDINGGTGRATQPDPETGEQEITGESPGQPEGGINVETSGDSGSSSSSSDSRSTGGSNDGSGNEHTATLDSPDNPEPETQTQDTAEGFGDDSQDQPAVIREKLDDQGNVVSREEYNRRWQSPSTSTPDQELDPVNPDAPEPVQEQQEKRQQQQREIRSANFQREQAGIQEQITRNRVQQLQKADEDTRYRVTDELAENVRNQAGVDVAVGDDNLVSREMLLEYRQNQANQLSQAQRELDAFSNDASQNLDRINQDIDTTTDNEGSAYQRWQQGDRLAADGSMTAPGDTPVEFQDGPERYYAEPDYYGGTQVDQPGIYQADQYPYLGASEEELARMQSASNYGLNVQENVEEATGNEAAGRAAGLLSATGYTAYQAPLAADALLQQASRDPSGAVERVRESIGASGRTIAGTQGVADDVGTAVLASPGSRLAEQQEFQSQLGQTQLAAGGIGLAGTGAAAGGAVRGLSAASRSDVPDYYPSGSVGRRLQEMDSDDEFVPVSQVEEAQRRMEYGDYQSLSPERGRVGEAAESVSRFIRGDLGDEARIVRQPENMYTEIDAGAGETRRIPNRGTEQSIPRRRRDVLRDTLGNRRRGQARLVPETRQRPRGPEPDTPGTRVDDFDSGTYLDQRLLDSDIGPGMQAGPGAATGAAAGVETNTVDTQLEGTRVDPGTGERFDQRNVMAQDQGVGPVQDQGTTPLLQQDTSQETAATTQNIQEPARTPGRQRGGGSPPIPGPDLSRPSPDLTDQDQGRNQDPGLDQAEYNPSLAAGVYDIRVSEDEINTEEEFTGLETRPIVVDTEEGTMQTRDQNGNGNGNDDDPLRNDLV